MSVQLQNVTFGYQPEKTILHKLSFSVPAGSKVALSGHNGSGKSTVLKLLTGAYPQFEGAVLINNVPIGNYNLQALRKNIGVLLSEEDVFLGTLWENLALGNESADRDYILWLCNQTGLNEYIAAQKEGFDTELDPTGKRLPRSVVRQILLVRALATKPSLLLLEEPLAALEPEAKERVSNLLLQLSDTTLIAATNDVRFGECCSQTIMLSPVNTLEKEAMV